MIVLMMIRVTNRTACLSYLTSFMDIDRYPKTLLAWKSYVCKYYEHNVYRRWTNDFKKSSVIVVAVSILNIDNIRMFDLLY